MNFPLNKIIDHLRSLNGVLLVKKLDDQHIGKLRELEKEYMMIKTRLGVPVNEGMLRCLDMQYVLALLTNSHFKWPKGPYALIYIGNILVGEINENGIRIFKNKISKASKLGGIRRVVFPSLKLELSSLGISVTMASPSPPSHEYILKNIFKVDAGNVSKDLGTALIGIDDP